MRFWDFSPNYVYYFIGKSGRDVKLESEKQLEVGSLITVETTLEQVNGTIVDMYENNGRTFVEFGPLNTIKCREVTPSLDNTGDNMT